MDDEQKSSRFRSDVQTVIDRRNVAVWLIEGKRPAEIMGLMNTQTRAFPVSKKVCQSDIEYAKDLIREKAMVDVTTAKGRQLAVLERVEKEAWEGWERSCRPAEVTKEVKEPTEVAANGKRPMKRRVIDVTEVTRTVTNQAGDPRFLHVIVDVEKRIAELFGIDAPQRHQVEGRHVGVLVLKHSHELSQAERATIGGRRKRFELNS